ncbi:MAG: hypothetical protein IKB61_01900 [Elusimicrobiaceae bacterium]|nr:hypothetical protein [Elusimicrobiaceae bacterium]
MANYAYYCLHKLKITPRQFDEMDRYEKAFIIAAIDIKLEKDDKEAKKLKSKRKR